jgi:hypothetical protein
MDGSFVTRANRRREIPASQTEGAIHKADQRRDFDERADQADEGLAGVQSEHSDCDRDSQFKIVTRCSGGAGRRLRVVRSQLARFDRPF